MPSTKKFFVPVALAFLFLFNSCGLWRDFTTYFNTYYNAKTLFDRLEEEILSQKKDPFEFRESSTQTGQTQSQPYQQQQYQQQQQQFQQPQFQQQQQFQNVQQTQTTQQFPSQRSSVPAMSMVQIKQELTRVIEKCSRILQFHKESSYVDDALFITGKSFYYQQEYASAQRKFLELASIQESSYHLENKLWLAKTYLQLRSFDEGLALIDEVKNDAIAAKKEKLLIDASITLIGFYLYREENRKAIDECNWLLGKIDDDEISALLSFQLGKINLKIGNEEEALNAFASVLKYSPTFEIEFESRIEHARLLKQLGRIDESEEKLVDLRDRGKFNTQMDRILVELGQVYYDKNQYEKAVKLFKEVDSTYKFNPTSGMASFKLGEIYERHYRDYDSSLKYYSKATSSFVERDIKTKANDRARNFDRYFSLKKTIADLNTQVIYIKQPEKFLRDSIDYDIAFKEFTEENRRKSEMLQANLQTQQVNIEQRQIPQQNPQLDLQNQTKRKEEVTLAMLISLGKVQKPSRPQISIDSLGTLLSQNYYNLGSHFFSEMDVPDSAYYYFKLILEEYPQKPNTPQTLFALGTYYETINEKQKADSLYKIIYEDYSKSGLYTEAGKKLGLIKEEVKKTVVATADPAEPLYIAAEERYYSKEFRDAIKAFREIYLNHPESSYAPKSIYYIGLIHEELKEYDSSAFYYGILSTKEYAATPLGKAVFAKYNEYKNEKDRIEREEQLKRDSENQKKLEEQKPLEHDSTKIKQKEVISPVEKDDIPIRKLRADSLKSKSDLKPESDSLKPKPDTLLKRTEQKFETDSLKQRTDSLKKKIF
jgi:tetratricopeptide (TPR) repeat protein